MENRLEALHSSLEIIDVGGGDVIARLVGVVFAEREMLLTAATSPKRRSRCCSKYVFSGAVDPFAGAMSVGNGGHYSGRDRGLYVFDNNATRRETALRLTSGRIPLLPRDKGNSRHKFTSGEAEVWAHRDRNSF